jgi:hypothetical protein
MASESKQRRGGQVLRLQAQVLSFLFAVAELKLWRRIQTSHSDRHGSEPYACMHACMNCLPRRDRDLSRAESSTVSGNQLSRRRGDEYNNGKWERHVLLPASTVSVGRLAPGELPTHMPPAGNRNVNREFPSEDLLLRPVSMNIDSPPSPNPISGTKILPNSSPTGY